MVTQVDYENCVLDSALIGQRIKIARKAKRQTQEELAHFCNCTPTHICNIENGKIGISLDLLFRISVILEKSLDYFVMDNPYVKPEIKISMELAPKLSQCDSQMLDMVDSFVERLIQYRNGLVRTNEEKQNENK